MSSKLLAKDQQIILTLETTTNPNDVLHVHSFIFDGQMTLQIGEYSKTIERGQTTRFTPRSDLGLPPWPLGTEYVMTSTRDDTYYICVYNKTLTPLTWTSITTTDQPQSLPADNLIIPLDNITINQTNLWAKTPYLISPGDVLDPGPGSTALIFSI